MSRLRDIALITMTAVTLIAVIGIISAIYELWLITVGLLFGAMIMSVLTTLMVARYVSRNARTGEQRSKVITQRLFARVKASMERQSEANDELQSLINASHDSLREDNIATRKALTSLEENLAEQGQTAEELAKTNRHHTANTVRDSTRQVESLVHIYARYPEVKLPMPNTGGFAIDSQALAHLLAIVEERRPQRILELGSGTSTLWMGYLCRSYGGKVVTLDHLEHYLGLTRSAINRHDLNDVIESRLAPLEPTESDGKTYNWYSTDALEDLTDIDMVIVDGPPAATGPQARYPSLPKMIRLLAPDATVILDDAHRKDEAQIVDSWLAAFPEFSRIEHGTSRLAVLERKAP